MKSIRECIPLRLLSREDGGALPMMVLMSVLLLGMGGFAVDVGQAHIAKIQLQASTDAAALAGGYAMSLPNATSASVSAAVSAQSSATGGTNTHSYFSNVAVTPTLKCLTTVANLGIPCTASTTGSNAVQVVQSAQIRTGFIRIISLLGANPASTMTIMAKSTAAMRGAVNAQYNVAIVIDTTASMGNQDSDASCGNTRIYCALQGVRTLLQSLSPCTASSTSTSCTAFDQVSLFTFPNVQANTASRDTTCPTSNPSIPNYSTPAAGATWSAPTGSSATYQITTYMSNYSANNKANGGLNSSSALGIAAGASGSGTCKGLQTPGGVGTYYAAAIYAAQSSLVAAQAANPGSLNALIVLSDGDASTTKMTNGQHNGNTYPSLDYQCSQAVTAARYASAHGTTVFTISYGASNSTSSSCSTDNGTISACSALKQMATAPANFYSDATASQNQGQCTSSSNPNLTLNQIFKSVATQFTVARLIPDNAT